MFYLIISVELEYIQLTFVFLERNCRFNIPVDTDNFAANVLIDVKSLLLKNLHSS